MNTSNEDIRDKLIARQIRIMRTAAGTGKEMNRLLKMVDADLQGLIERRTDVLTSDLPRFTSVRTRRLLRLQDDIKELQRPTWIEIRKDLRENLLEIGQLESGFAAVTIEAALPVVVSLDLPNSQVLRKILTSQPFEGKILSRWMSELEAADRSRMMAQIRIGLVQGDSSVQIGRRIFGTGALNNVDGVRQLTRASMQSTVNTATNFITNEARQELYLANKAIIPMEVYTATLDARTSSICQSLDGRRFPVGRGETPPVHFNSLVHGTLIETERGLVPIESVMVGEAVMTHTGKFQKVLAVMAKSSKGEIVIQVKESSGRVIELSDQHPMLCRSRGWVHAGDLQVGDESFQYTDQPSRLEAVASIILKANDHEPQLSESFVSGFVASQPGTMASSIKFNDDEGLRKQEVNDKIVNDGLMEDLSRGEPSFLLTHIKEWLFSLADCISETGSKVSAHLCANFFHLRWVRNLHSFTGITSERHRLHRLLLHPMFITKWLSDMFGIRDNTFDFASYGNPVSLTKTIERRFPHATVSFNRPDGKALPPMLLVNNRLDFLNRKHFGSSMVVEIDCIPYTGQLYDLEVEKDNSYIANSFIVHNCRSIRVPEINGRLIGQRPANATTKKLLEGMRGEERRKAVDRLVGQVPASETYQVFLKKQTTAFQNEVLGVTKGRLFREGGLTVDRFVNPAGKELTLSQLKRLEPQAFKRAGIE